MWPLWPYTIRIVSVYYHSGSEKFASEERTGKVVQTLPCIFALVLWSINIYLLSIFETQSGAKVFLGFAFAFQM